jgi:pimeloyl-ACP methyl ester carboxylesterase
MIARGGAPILSTPDEGEAASCSIGVAPLVLGAADGHAGGVNVDITPEGSSAGPQSRRRFLRTGTAGLVGLSGFSALAGAVPAIAKREHKHHGKRHPHAAPVHCDRVIPLSDVVISARVIGKGPLIVIHPSLGRSARDLDGLTHQLALRGYRSVAFDPRGCGQTKAPDAALQNLTLHTYANDMRAVIEAFGGGPAHVLGHALGNRVARLVAVDHPTVVRKVILVACGGGVPNSAAISGLLTATGSDAPLPVFEQAVRDTFFAAGSDPTPWYVGWSTDGATAERNASLATDISEYEGGGNAPVLAIQGVEDVVAPPSIGHDLQARYGPRFEIRDILHAGHALPVERPKKVAALIDDYLRRRRK